MLKPIPTAQSELELQIDVDLIYNLTNSLKLKLNHSKTKYIVFGLHPSPPCLVTSISLGPDQIEQVEEFKYLGVLVDHRLTFAHHAQTVSLKAKRAIGAIVRLFKHATPRAVLEKVFKAVIVPQLTYAIEIWYPKGAVWRSKLERYKNTFSNNT